MASVNRGCKAIAESGGALTNSRRVGATRGPVFYILLRAGRYQLLRLDTLIQWEYTLVWCVRGYIANSTKIG